MRNKGRLQERDWRTKPNRVTSARIYIVKWVEGHFNSSRARDYKMPVEPLEETSRELSSKWKFYNVIILGLGFFLLFTAFQTTANVQVCFVCCKSL